MLIFVSIAVSVSVKQINLIKFKVKITGEFFSFIKRYYNVN